MSRTEKIICAALVVLAVITFGVALTAGMSAEKAGYAAGLAVSTVLALSWAVWANYTGTVEMLERADRERRDR